MFVIEVKRVKRFSFVYLVKAKQKPFLGGFCLEVYLNIATIATNATATFIHTMYLLVFLVDSSNGITSFSFLFIECIRIDAEIRG